MRGVVMLYDLIMYHCVTNAEQRKSDERWLLKEVLGYNINEADKILSKDEQMIAINLTAEQVHKILPPFYAYGSVILPYKSGTSDYVFSFAYDGATLVHYKHENDSTFCAKEIEGYDPNIYDRYKQSKKSHYYDHPVIGAENRADLSAQPKPAPIRTESIFPENIPTCPFCNSTDVHKISGGERVMSIIGLGIFSNKINKSFKCKSCKGTF